MSYIEDAFNQVCEDAEPTKSAYVSLYVSSPFYGGPEEGGWWGRDVSLVSTFHCMTMEKADAVLEKVKELAKELSEKAKQDFYTQCRNELDAADRRGIDYDSLREVDGEETYFVVKEEIQGEQSSRGSRHWD